MDSDQQTEPTRYGADAHGLVCGYRFDADTAAQPLGSDEAAQWLADAAQGSGFAWLHFNLAHAGAERWLRRHAGLSDAFFEALQGGLHSTRIERDEDALVAVINDVQFDFAFESSDIATLWIAVDKRLVVTARQSALRSVDQLRLAIRRGDPMRSSVELLERLLRAQADVLVDVVRGVTRRIDEIEDALLADRLQHKRTRLGVLRRLLVRLQRLLAPEPAALFRLLQHPPAWMVERDVDELRQATEEFSVALRDMTALQERTKLLQEEIAAAVNERTSRSLFVLTVVTVLALPINILAGLFGMNVGGVPLAENPHGFWILVAVVIAFTAVAGWLAFRGRNDR
ncbi:transporter [Pseudorhodoferax sp. Leaf274]|uniref:transporter n=1 Tax=Pseudorhodoferax sp. Leaf274 TaxID=1736318 RepID=UPI0007029879|nr:transporter [Pseudorhodoferax sp. Leaf274]KQP44208.1 magnesium transporter CorA [Pseudorhodoferax sp. Leaf274]